MALVKFPWADESRISQRFERPFHSLQHKKHFEKEEKEEDMLRYERQYGSFYRSIPFPVQIDDSKLKAKLKDGVLKITLPKTPAAIAKSKNIQIEKA